MKKIFYLLAFTLLTGTLVIVGCSDDKETTPSSDITTKSLETPEVKSEVPRDRALYRSLDKAEHVPIDELIDLYKSDVNTAEDGYATNLKNMWFAVLKNRIATEGTEEQKLFFIKEQASLPNNLAFFNDFYNLLAKSRLLDRTEKENMANAFYEKNIRAINEVQWATPKEKKNKESELVYAKRVFTNLVNTR